MTDITPAQSETKTIPLSQGKVAIVDAADFEWLSQFNWFAIRPTNIWYAVRNRKRINGARKLFYMHRDLLDPPSGVLVDHRDGDGLNNTWINLRLANGQQNSANHAGRRNHTGFKGVSWNKERQRWTAQIQVDGKQIRLGRFVTAEEAARAYDLAAREAYGEFAWTNFPIGATQWP